MNTRRATQQAAASYQQQPRKAPIGAFIQTEQPAYLIEHEKMMQAAATSQSTRDEPVQVSQPVAAPKPQSEPTAVVPVALVKKPKVPVKAVAMEAKAEPKPVQMKPKKPAAKKPEEPEPAVISEYEQEIVARYLKIDDEMIDLKNQIENLKAKKMELQALVTQIMKKTGGAPVKSGNTEIKVTTKTIKESMTKPKLIEGLAASGFLIDPKRSSELVDLLYKGLGVRETKDEIKRK